MKKEAIKPRDVMVKAVFDSFDKENILGVDLR